MRAKSYNKGPKEASSQAPRRPVAASSEPQEREPTAHTPHSAGPPSNFFLICVGGRLSAAPKLHCPPGCTASCLTPRAYNFGSHQGRCHRSAPPIAPARPPRPHCALPHVAHCAPFAFTRLRPGGAVGYHGAGAAPDHPLTPAVAKWIASPSFAAQSGYAFGRRKSWPVKRLIDRRVEDDSSVSYLVE